MHLDATAQSFPAILGSFILFLEFPYRSSFLHFLLLTFSSPSWYFSSLPGNHSISQFSHTFIPFLLASCHTFQAYFILLLKDMKPFTQSLLDCLANPCPPERLQLIKISEGTIKCLLNPSLLVVTLSSYFVSSSFLLSFIQPHNWKMITALLIL